MGRRTASTSVKEEVAAIGDLPREELLARWQPIYGSPPPNGIRNELMRYAVAWRFQARRLGGFSPETRRLLKHAVGRIRTKMIAARPLDPDAPGNAFSEDSASGAGTVKVPSLSKSDDPIERRTLSPGARLIRDWNGRTHVIDVTERGFLFEGQSYRSLSAIARKITGAHWSGPRFFGL